MIQGRFLIEDLRYPALDFEEISMYLRLAWLNCYHLVIYVQRCYFIQLYSSERNKDTLINKFNESWGIFTNEAQLPMIGMEKTYSGKKTGF